MLPNALTFPTREQTLAMRNVPHLSPSNIQSWFGGYKAIWAANDFKQSHRAAYHSVQPGGKLGFYMSSCTARPGDAAYDCEMIERDHPDWFLKSNAMEAVSPENRIVYTDGNRWYVDITNPDVQDYIALRAVSLSDGWDAISFDNCLLGTDRVRKVTVSHPNWAYAGQEREWCRRFIEFLERVKVALNAHQRLLIVNTSLDPISPEDGISFQTIRRGSTADCFLFETPMQGLTDRGYEQCVEQYIALAVCGVKVWWSITPKLRMLPDDASDALTREVGYIMHQYKAMASRLFYSTRLATQFLSFDER